MTVRAYQWLGVALFACMAGLLLLMAQNKIGLDFDWFERIAWGVAIAYVAGGVFVVRRERDKEAGRSNSSDADSTAYPVLSERVIPPVAPMRQPKRGYALSVAVFLGLLAIAVVLGYHYKVERDRAACYELMSTARSTFGGRAAEVISVYLKGHLKPEWEQSVIEIEDTYNLTFENCRRTIGGVSSNYR